ncbi:MAG: tetratricopeptide repeat protein [Gammaproteobacteria bacterium]|nr:tetratricopeptide repeat protein [Gammaproteobacteria bacterium]
MQLYEELKRRNVFRVAAAYIVSAWLIIQVAETILPLFGLGDAVVRGIVIVLAIGFIPALVLSWAFELTPDGLKRDKDVDTKQSAKWQSGKKLDRVIVVILAFALAYFSFDKFLLDPARDAEQFETARREGRIEALITNFGNRSIAVLPFADMSPQNDQGYFSDGIAEELLNLLASIPEVRVTSRSSAFSFKGQNLSVPEIARRLSVTYVLDGSVRKFGDQIRISAQLIDAESDTQLWSKNFDRKLDNIFQIQDEIASDVIQQIKGTLQIAAPKQRQTNAAAYALYLQARHQRRLGTAEGYKESVRLYREAIAIDPSYPPAWDELAASYQSQAVTGLAPSEEAFALAREAALKAIEIDPDYAPAYNSLGYLAQYYEPDLARAARHYRRALELAPNDAGIIGSAGILLHTLGRTKESIPPIEFSASSDPLSAGWKYMLGLAYLSDGQTSEAVSLFEAVLALSPEFSLAYHNLGIALLLDGRPDEAVAALQKEKRENWRLIGLAMALFALAPPNDQSLAEVEGVDAAELALNELVEKYGDSSAYNIAYVYAYRNQPDEAFAWLKTAVETGDPGVGEVISQPLFNNLHNDPRWIPFLAMIGKAPEQLAGIRLDVVLPD